MLDDRIKVIKRRRLHEEIVQQIQELVRDGSLKHGDRLPPERDLAERLRVSRSSLREAMRALELQGLVISRPGAGTFINTDQLDTVASIIASCLMDSGDVLQDMFGMRRLLEPGIAALAAERATEEDLEQMEVILVEQAKQVERGETGVEGDTAFHFALAQATQNASLIKVVMTVADILRQSRDRSLQSPGRAYRSLASHRAMLDIIRRRDVEGAREAMEHHLAVVEPAQVLNSATGDTGHGNGVTVGGGNSPLEEMA